MRKNQVIFIIIALFFAIGCTKKNEVQKTTEKYFEYVKNGKYEAAWNMLDKESQEIIGREKFVSEAKRIKDLSFFLKFKDPKVSKDGSQAIIDTEFTGQKKSYNKLPDMKVSFWVQKEGGNYKIKLKKLVDEIKEEEKKEAIEIPINPEMIETAKKYKDKIEIKDLKNGEVTFDNGLSQYMMEATVKNNSDQNFSYIGALVKFMDEKEENVLFEKTFFLVYTRQIEGIYPIKPKEERNVVIPGYAAEDITTGRWTGKLQWEVHAVKIATPEEMITID